MEEKKISRFIEKLYDEYHKSLWGYAYFLSKDKNIADDIVQTVFMNIIKHEKRLRRIFSGDIPAYLKVAVKNAYINYVGKEKREKEKSIKFAENTESYDEPIIESDEDLYELFNKAKKVLTNREKDVIYLIFNLDFSRTETAETLGISTNNVYVTLHNALKKLRIEFTKENVDEE